MRPYRWPHLIEEGGIGRFGSSLRSAFGQIPVWCDVVDTHFVAGAAGDRIWLWVTTRVGNAAAMEMHAGQLTVSGETVRAMVDGQFPVWRALPIRAVTGTGTDNAIFRIGEQFVARFPLQAEAVETTCQHLRAEAAAARESDGRTQFATPEPVALGKPGAGYRCDTDEVCCPTG